MKTLYSAIILVNLILLSKGAFSQEYCEFDTTLTMARAPFSYYAVVDQRSNTLLGNLKNVDFTTAEPSGVALERYLNRIIPRDASGDTLVLVLHRLRVQDKPYYGDIVTFHFDGDFYMGGNDRYVYLGVVDTFSEEKFKVHFIDRALKSFSQNILDAVVYGSWAVNPSESETYSLAEIADRREHLQNQFEIYETQRVKNGIYLTMDDFLNQTPKDTPIVKRIDRTYGSATPYFYYPNKNGSAGTQIRNFFAIKFNGSVYCNYNGFGSKMRFVNGDIYAEVRILASYWDRGGFHAQTMLTNAVLKNTKEYGVFEARLNPLTKTFKPVRRIE